MGWIPAYAGMTGWDGLPQLEYEIRNDESGVIEWIPASRQQKLVLQHLRAGRRNDPENTDLDPGSAPG